MKSARAGYRYREAAASYRRRIGVSKVGGTRKGGVRASIHMVSTLRYPRWGLRDRASRPAVARASL